MNTSTTRTVTPQWNSEVKGHKNLGEFAVPTVEIDKSNVEVLASLYPAGLARLASAQASISLGPVFIKRVKALLPARLEDEKIDIYAERVYDDALKAAKTVATQTFDFTELLVEWDRLANREAKDAREVLSNFDTVVTALTNKWIDASEAGRTKLLETLKLDVALLPASTADVLTALRAKYRAPSVSVDADNLLA